MSPRRDSRLLDRQSIILEYGVTEHVADAWVRQLVKVHYPGGVRKDFVRRRDLDRMLKEAETRA